MGQSGDKEILQWKKYRCLKQSSFNFCNRTELSYFLNWHSAWKKTNDKLKEHLVNTAGGIIYSRQVLLKFPLSWTDFASVNKYRHVGKHLCCVFWHVLYVFAVMFYLILLILATNIQYWLSWLQQFNVKYDYFVLPHALLCTARSVEKSVQALCSDLMPCLVFLLDVIASDYHLFCSRKALFLVSSSVLIQR